MDEKATKNYRILEIYVRLCEGKTVNKSEAARKFRVDERTIQRDIDDIRAFIADKQITSSGDTRTIELNMIALKRASLWLVRRLL